MVTKDAVPQSNPLCKSIKVLISVTKLPPLVTVKSAVVMITFPPASVLVIYLLPALKSKFPPAESVSVCPFKSIVLVALVEPKVKPLLAVTTALVPVASFKVPIP